MKRLILLLALVSAEPAVAQVDIRMTPIAVPAQPTATPLDTRVLADMPPESWFEDHGQRIVRNVSRATLTPVLSYPAKATSAAVIVALGGGFLQLSMDGEGWQVARWLADHGIAAFVLKYRLRATPAKLDDYRLQVIDRIAAVRSKGADAWISRPPPRSSRTRRPRCASSGDGLRPGTSILGT